MEEAVGSLIRPRMSRSDCEAIETVVTREYSQGCGVTSRVSE